MVQKDILAKLTTDQITKIVVEPGQGDIITLESELAEKAAKIKSTEKMFEKGWKYGFLEVVIGKTKYGRVIGNVAVQWTTTEKSRGYGESNKPKDIGGLIKPHEESWRSLWATRSSNTNCTCHWSA